MGKTQSKEEVIIAQTASGDATGSLNHGFSLTEWLLIGLLVAVILIIIYLTRSRYKKTLQRSIRREILNHELRKSRDEINEEV